MHGRNDVACRVQARLRPDDVRRDDGNGCYDVDQASGNEPVVKSAGAVGVKREGACRDGATAGSRGDRVTSIT